MKSAGLNVVRMSEFAWSKMEPKAADFHFDWLDRAINLLAENGIASVLGTPTAAPPAWLVQTYPDMLAVEENGNRVQFGNRCHYCVNSPEFHLATQRIVHAMAEHFGSNRNVIGWQIDNEYNRVCYCERCRTLFQKYLAEKYETLEELNEHWSTAYWSQSYSSWDQIPIPIGGHNPGLMLEFKRFITESYKQFQKVQIDQLRPYLSDSVWVTHNFMGWFDGFDHYRINEDLDIASWDWYIGTGHHNYLKTGAVHDLTRGFKNRNFWVIETQPANVNWTSLNNVLNKGEGRAMAWHAIAHGADAFLYWQWRSALNGQEQYHGSLVDQSGQPRPFTTEVQRLGQEFKKNSQLIAGSVVKAHVAMLNDYESRWSIQWQPHHRDFDYVAHFNHYYRSFAKRNISVDILSALSLTDASQLLEYKLIIAPALLIVNEQLAVVLRDYVEQGGHLILTIRSGMKDSYNALHPARQPGPLADIAGVEVEEYYALDEPAPVKGNWFEGKSQIWAERLKPSSKTITQVIAKYGKSNGWLDDGIAITVTAYGRGLVYYVGAYLDEAAQDEFLGRLIRTADITSIDSPDGVEISIRFDSLDKEIYFCINHKPNEQTVDFPWIAMDQISGQPVNKKLKLEPYGVAVLTTFK